MEYRKYRQKEIQVELDCCGVKKTILFVFTFFHVKRGNRITLRRFRHTPHKQHSIESSWTIQTILFQKVVHNLQPPRGCVLC